ncbi:MAG TPA: hypothetical protein VNW06_00005 [Cytophagaceae bacterium]|jgi:hypothetical protein|nr:hypothetical protein [Cytophagaceae bacterium]
MNQFPKIGRIIFVILLVLSFVFSEKIKAQTVSCNGYNPWVATQTYNTQTVFLNNVLYQSQWNNLNSNPSTNNGSGQAWTIVGSCALPITPASTSCANISTWSSATAYAGSSQVAWNGYKYTANFWTQGSQPDVNSDNSWTLVAACQSPASLSVSGSLTSFTGYVGSFSTAQSFTITGANLSTNVVTVTAPTHFEISTNQTTGYTSSLSLTPTSGSLSATIYVEYSPSTLGSDNGNIVISSTGVTTQDIAVSGAAQAIWLANGNYIYNANTGNVGIGTTVAPTAKLEVVGTTKTTGLQIPTGAGKTKVLTSDSLGNGTWQTADFSNGWKLAGNSNVDGTSFIGTTTAQPIIFKTNNVEGFRIAANGNVTVGSYATAPASKLAVNGTMSIGSDGYVPAGYTLAVNGTILATEVAVKLRTKWPDYVFSKDYKLMSLGEVEQYIKKNKHLPGILSEKEVKEKGIELANMNTLLLEKIEELTLHTIDHKKTIDLQSKQIEDQQKLNEKLLKLIEEYNTRIQKLEQK